MRSRAGRAVARERSRGRLYQATVRAMIAHLRAAALVGAPPRFALPPREVAVIGELSQVPGLCRDARARELVVELIAIAVRIGGPEGEPTILMLDHALEAAGIAVERLPLSDLGVRRFAWINSHLLPGKA